VPPDTFVPVGDEDAPGVLDEPPLLHAAIPTASTAAAPATAIRASRDLRLFRNIDCAPWL
jgi:hypothetical protein